MRKGKQREHNTHTKKNTKIYVIIVYRNTKRKIKICNDTTMLTWNTNADQIQINAIVTKF